MTLGNAYLGSLEAGDDSIGTGTALELAGLTVSPWTVHPRRQVGAELLGCRDEKEASALSSLKWVDQAGSTVSPCLNGNTPTSTFPGSRCVHSTP